jgi:hypothetical protein
MKRSLFILFSLSLVFSLFFHISSAQAQVDTISGSDINITLIPDNPAPGDTVTASVTTYVSDINAATISWSLNGKVSASGIGNKTFTFKVGAAGTVTQLGISVRTKEGATMQQSIAINPSSVDLVWESQGYTPPFYKGKALFSYQNDVVIIAMPHIVSNGKEISPKNLIYKWSKNGTVDEDQSGYGKDTFTVKGSILSRAFNVSVEVSSSDTTAVGNAIVGPTDPLVVFYEKSPLYGIEFQEALQGTVAMQGQEMSVTAIPYFFGSLDTKALSYDWKINGAEIDRDLSQSTRTFRYAAGTKGTSNISVSIQHDSKVLQLASQSFSLNFGSAQDAAVQDSF